MRTEQSSDPIIAIGDYDLRSRLGGEGPLSIVWRAVHRPSGEEVVLKQVRLSALNRKLRECLDCELRFLGSVKHPNIIRLIDVIQADGSVFLVLEFCKGGNLATYIRCNGRVQEHIVRNFMRQIGAGLEVLHGHHIIHCDLKPEVDMWSIGVILFELLNGYPPFSGRSNVQLLQNIKSSRSLPFSQLIMPSLHSDSVDMCNRLLCSNPVNRLSFDEFYHHKFIR
ncbi:serine/threonine-protein kinase ATG1t isoform X3 [Typha angustifolia]|uniref:serine/threonine-protein kinase ATG1t isoform X3 n=1 Tax=Typha angustifolia TaxID=59011 RepID=UPI003C2AB63F